MYRALRLGRLGFRGANDFEDQTGRAPFARRWLRGRESETSLREGCQILALRRSRG